MEPIHIPTNPKNTQKMAQDLARLVEYIATEADAPLWGNDIFGPENRIRAIKRAIEETRKKISVYEKDF